MYHAVISFDFPTQAYVASLSRVASNYLIELERYSIEHEWTL